MHMDELNSITSDILSDLSNQIIDTLNIRKEMNDYDNFSRNHNQQDMSDKSITDINGVQTILRMQSDPNLNKLSNTPSRMKSETNQFSSNDEQ